MNLIEQLQDHVPETVLAELPALMATFHINTPLRLAHFLAQCSHESGKFRHVRENLNYSADGLLKTFPAYFTPAQAAGYARQPERIASRVYASRLGNGDEASRDGWLYRGAGYIQLTGKTNFQAFDKFVPEDVVRTPDLVARKYALLSAGWFFHVNQINRIADGGVSDADVTAVSRRVNGGTNGLADRLAEFRRFYALLTPFQS